MHFFCHIKSYCHVVNQISLYKDGTKSSKIRLTHSEISLRPNTISDQLFNHNMNT